MGAFVDITAADLHRMAAWLATPQGKPRGGLVVIQTAFGVDGYLQGVCEAYARDGYVTIAPALYDRQRRGAVFEHTPEGGKAAGAMRNAFVWDDVLKDVEAARRRVASFGRVGIAGYCVGGSIVWLRVAPSGGRSSAISSLRSHDIRMLRSVTASWASWSRSTAPRKSGSC